MAPMTTKRLPRPRDPIQLGKLIGDIATGQVEDRERNDNSPADAATQKKRHRRKVISDLPAGNPKRTIHS